MLMLASIACGLCLVSNDLLSSVCSLFSSVSRMSVQQSSITSSHGEPKAKPSVAHVGLDEPITNPILQASQQS